MTEKRDGQFWDFMAVLDSVFSETATSALAFWLGLWRGEPARDRAIGKDDPDPAPETLAFELGLELRPVWTEIDGALRAALAKAAAKAIMRSLGLKKD